MSVSRAARLTVGSSASSGTISPSARSRKLSGASQESKQEMKDRIQVAVRARPLDRREAGNNIVWRFGEDYVEELKDDGVTPTGTNKHFYDHVFSPDAGTAEVYEKRCRTIVQGSLEGYNGTIFAYGQTASGKTFTLMGDPDTNPGVSIRAFDHVFSAVSRDSSHEWSITVSYVEIYNESVTDLLHKEISARSSLSGAGRNKKIYEDKKFGARVQDVVEHKVATSSDCLRVFKEGEKMRSYGTTGMNDASSRSHTIFQLRIQQNNVPGAEQAKSATNMRALANKFQAMERSLKAERATLYTVDHELQELHSQAGEIIIVLPMTAGLAGACASIGETIVLDDVYKDARFNSEQDKKSGFRTRSMCIVPMKSSGIVIGMAQFINKVGGGTFDSFDVAQAEEFAAEAGPLLGIALANAKVGMLGVLNLVDLAGSERTSKSGSHGSGLKEAGYINKSLMNLGACILSLSEGRTGRIPFRDSKLTMLLASSLGGNARTLIICAMSPATRNRNETISTLQFANRAKKIVNKVRQNTMSDSSEPLRNLMTELQYFKDNARRSKVVRNWQFCIMKVALSVFKKRAKARGTTGFQMKPYLEDKLKQVKAQAFQAETIVRAISQPAAPSIKLCVRVAANPDNMSDLKLVVEVVQLSSSPDTVPAPFEWITAEELNKRLECLRRMQSNCWLGATLEVDAWAVSRNMPAVPSSAPVEAVASAVRKSPAKAPTLDEVLRFRTELSTASSNLEHLRVELDDFMLRRARDSRDVTSNGLDWADKEELSPNGFASRKFQLSRLQDVLETAGGLIGNSRFKDYEHSPQHARVISSQLSGREPFPSGPVRTSSGSPARRLRHSVTNVTAAAIPFSSDSQSSGLMVRRSLTPGHLTPGVSPPMVVRPIQQSISGVLVQSPDNHMPARFIQPVCNVDASRPRSPTDVHRFGSGSNRALSPSDVNRLSTSSRPRSPSEGQRIIGTRNVSPPPLHPDMVLVPIPPPAPFVTPQPLPQTAELLQERVIPSAGETGLAVLFHDALQGKQWSRPQTAELPQERVIPSGTLSASSTSPISQAFQQPSPGSLSTLSSPPQVTVVREGVLRRTSLSAASEASDTSGVRRLRLVAAGSSPSLSDKREAPLVDHLQCLKKEIDGTLDHIRRVGPA